MWHIFTVVWAWSARNIRPVDSLLTTGVGGRFPQILDLFQGLKIGVPSGCLRETSTLKTIVIDDVTLWSQLEFRLYVYSILLA